MDVVATRRYEARTLKTAFIIRVSMEMTPPVMTVFPSLAIAVLSNIGLKTPTTQTIGSTTRSLYRLSFTGISPIMNIAMG